jgi:steroid 5-alpha reductase family enzyme
VNAWTHAAMAVALMALLFTVAWAWARRIDNYSLVDAVWAYGIGITSCLWLAMAGGGTLKSGVAAALVALWSLRLGTHLQRRIRSLHPREDARYMKLREVWQGRVPSAFLGFFLAQAASVVLLALPFLMVAMDPDAAWSAWESAGLLVCLTGICGESLADSQMARFKAANQGSKEVCQTGLWHYSRHPNYFFEALIWIGFYTYACGSAWGWATFHAPLAIIYLLLRVTGIPPTEAAAVLSRGDAYRRYQKTTSAFIPWPPKRGDHNPNSPSPP